MWFRSSLLVVLVAASVTRADDEERRQFSVTIDKRPAGTHRISIESKNDGTQVITSQADVKVRVLVISYKYTFRGSETWKNGRLLEMSTNTDDDGTKHSVTVKADRDGFSMQADGANSSLKGDYWVTTYWKLPAAKNRGPELTLLDADTGKLIGAKLEKVGDEQITAAGKTIDSVHYSLRGGVQVDLWYDSADRLVRQVMIEDGHQTTLELTNLDRN